MAALTIKLYAKEMNELLRSDQGPVFKDLVKVAEKVRVRAKELVGKDTHQLERSLTKRFERTGKELAAFVGSDLPYATYHHEGTPPHVIFPQKARVLHFVTKGGQEVFTTRVNHPGTKPNRFLTNALRGVIR